mgnify:CR=1 FL=1
MEFKITYEYRRKEFKNIQKLIIFIKYIFQNNIQFKYININKNIILKIYNLNCKNYIYISENIFYTDFLKQL